MSDVFRSFVSIPTSQPLSNLNNGSLIKLPDLLYKAQHEQAYSADHAVLGDL